MEYFLWVDEVVEAEEGAGLVEARDWRIAAAAAGPVASAPRVIGCEEVRIALPAPPRPVEM